MPLGGTRYLTDTNVAAMQAAAIWTGQAWIGWGKSLAEIAPDQPYTQPAPVSTGTRHYILDGNGIGLGELVLTVRQGTNVLAETSAWIDLRDVKDLYERAYITNNTTGAISNWTSALATVEYASVCDANESQDIVLYVHGAGNTVSTWLMRADTMFKRLYWAGYRGKFAAVRWPSPKLTIDLRWYDKSELHAFKAAAALKDYLNQLRGRFPGYRLHIFAHCQGAVPTSEALSLGAPFDTVILSQAAMPASC